ncbi:MAG TPA: SGNH/GDSL hydrolase family protein [Jatrophihabitantaceae bacterium]
MRTQRPRLAVVVSVAAVVVVATLGVTVRELAPRAGTHPAATVHAARASWVSSWAAMPQLTEPSNMPPAPFTQPGQVLTDTTLRQTVHVSLGAQVLRLRFSNAFGGAPLPLTAVSVALPTGGQAGVSAIQPGTTRSVTFDGHASTVVPTGALVVSDPVRLDVPAQANVTVTAYLADGQASDDITSHPGSRTTSYLLRGDELNASDLPGATPVDHWYFLSDLEVLAPAGSSAVDVVGDSLTDGRGSTTNGNDRWPDQLSARLQAHADTRRTGVINEAAGGNRVLNDGLGPNLLARFDRDVLAQTEISSVIVFEGVNDIGTAAATPSDQAAVGDELIAAYEQLVRRAHAHGLPVYGATITPFGGNSMYDDPAGLREQTRLRVNAWIRTSGTFDAVLDFDQVARDPQQPARLRPDFDVGDHLHLNPLGYAALAAAVPLRLVSHPGH